MVRTKDLSASCIDPDLRLNEQLAATARRATLIAQGFVSAYKGCRCLVLPVNMLCLNQDLIPRPPTNNMLPIPFHRDHLFNSKLSDIPTRRSRLLHAICATN